MGKIHLRHSAGEWICTVRLEEGNSSVEGQGEVMTKGIMPLLRVCSSINQFTHVVQCLLQNLTITLLL